MSDAIYKIIRIRDLYIPILTAFLEHKLSALAFQKQYLDSFEEDPYISPTPEIFDVLQAIFEDAMAYEMEPDSRYCEIDETEFRECTAKNLEKLKAIVQAYNLNS